MSPRLLTLAGVLLLALAAPSRAASGLDPAKALTQYGLDFWMTEQGLPQNTVTALTETGDGYLWVGTYDGLARMKDGRVTTWSVRDGLPSAVVWDIRQDRRGTLWLATGQGLARFRDGRFDVLGTKDGFPDDVAYSLREDRLFQRFGRTTVHPTAGEAATGLGLSIVKRLAELHGGRVWAESAGRGQGSTLVVELPAARAAA